MSRKFRSSGTTLESEVALTLALLVVVFGFAEHYHYEERSIAGTTTANFWLKCFLISSPAATKRLVSNAKYCHSSNREVSG
jgi:hypothetical protein